MRNKTLTLAIVAVIVIVVVAVFALRSRTPAPTPPPDPDPAPTPSAPIFFIAKADGNVYGVDNTGAQTLIASGPVIQIATKPGSSNIYGVNGSGQVAILGGKAPIVIPNSWTVSAVAFELSSGRMFGLAWGDSTVFGWNPNLNSWAYGDVPGSGGATKSLTFGPDGYMYGVSAKTPSFPMQFRSTGWASLPEAPGPLASLVFDPVSGVYFGLRSDTGEILSSPEINNIPLRPSGLPSVPGAISLAPNLGATVSGFTVIVKPARRGRRPVFQRS